MLTLILAEILPFSDTTHSSQLNYASFERDAVSWDDLDHSDNCQFQHRKSRIHAASLLRKWFEMEGEEVKEVLINTN
jgi:hypothetical protein